MRDCQIIPSLPNGRDREIIWDFEFNNQTVTVLLYQQLSSLGPNLLLLPADSYGHFGHFKNLIYSSVGELE